MTTPRSVKVSQQLKRQLAEMLARDIKDERISGLVSITDVETTSDCRSARVYISVFGDESAQKGTIEALTEQVGRIRGELGRRLNLRFAPELSFRLDNSLERGAKISEILSKISRGEI